MRSAIFSVVESIRRGNREEISLVRCGPDSGHHRNRSHAKRAALDNTCFREAGSHLSDSYITIILS